MSSVFSRQAAQRFSDLLETDRPNTHNELSPLLSLAQQLNYIGGTVRADDEFVARCRTRLMAVAAVQNVDSQTAHPRSAWRRNYQGLRRREDGQRRVPRRLALLAGTLAAMLGVSGVSMASGSAVPGDTLYSFKRNSETLQLAFARSDISRGQLRLQFARTRLGEAEGIANTAQVDSMLDDADADARSAMRDLGDAALSRSSTSPLDSIDQFVVNQRKDLQSWMDKLPIDKRTRAAESLTVLDQVQQRSTALRSALSCKNGSANTNGSDELGLIPGTCLAARSVEHGASPKPDGRGAAPAQHGAATGSATSSAPSPSPEASPAPSSVVPPPNLLKNPATAPGVQPSGAPTNPLDFLNGFFTGASAPPK
ncbi:MAG: hypothetical protein DLM55_08690 [Acidimicrobiales bacterium]|nr:MAG: hypothetical protein DLM55_08690 [Acidimicrobiales bacterium]